MAVMPAFGVNRFDFTSPPAFAADVRRAEELGWDYAFTPSTPLLVRDEFVDLAFAAERTKRIGLGPLIVNPVMRHPAVIASSIATVADLAPGRTLLTYGVGDTAVRLMGRHPATVAQLSDAVSLTRGLLSGEEIEVPAAARRARLVHAAPVPVWVAAGGPRTLRMAGRIADGVFIRVGRHPANLRTAIDAVRAGAAEAGREPGQVKIGAVFHTVLDDDPERAALISRSVAAGYYEYSPQLFGPPGFAWNGPPIEELKEKVWPDFHHTADMPASGRVVSFLSDEVADAFALHGTPAMIAGQLEQVLAGDLPISLVVTHPTPATLPGSGQSPFLERVAAEVLPVVRQRLGPLAAQHRPQHAQRAPEQ
ncbi:LLM class flavin-dependent oxidoreductase [Streptomyces sp. NPDC127084]|uniref:LLM class flavin-dependent oxidoreductase n=1 Tax=Streptomyces sp. NPDC127084 TaxID=3347133 RepID=UPI0036667D7B